MNASIDQSLNFLTSLPLSKKISLVFVIFLVLAGFGVMFFWANQEDYQVLFANVASEDGGAIVAKLEEQNVPYRVAGGGTTILVPAQQVAALRLSLAGDGLPSNGNVGFEIFDNVDFKTTKFVQELNYRRALQGELARTINAFKEVKKSRVFIVIPKESLFVEDRKPASASIQLDLRTSLEPAKLAAIVHLVANAVEGLSADQVTVVDTKGRLIFKGGNAGGDAALMGSSKLEYKRKIETQIKENVEGMLEGIVGNGNAIVSVTAEIDFDKVTMNEEEYDPATATVRSERNIQETSRTSGDAAEGADSLINNRRGVLPAATTGDSRQSRDVATNYEINKITRTVLKASGTVTRLSVAAVINGVYQAETQGDGTVKETYVPRTKKELQSFEELVKKAMGYSADREDQITVSSMQFRKPATTEAGPIEGRSEYLELLTKYGKTGINLLLVLLVFLVVVRPLLKSVKTVSSTMVVNRSAIEPVSELGGPGNEIQRLSPRERIIEVSKSKPLETQQLIKGWIGEQE